MGENKLRVLNAGECLLLYQRTMSTLGLKALPDPVPVALALEFGAEVSRQGIILFCEVNGLKYPGV